MGGLYGPKSGLPWALMGTDPDSWEDPTPSCPGRAAYAGLSKASGLYGETSDS
jgi:hypothetical protein